MLHDPNVLFLKTLDDLSKRIQAEDAYEILGAAGLIRKLFLDDYPLVDQVNRNHRVKLAFTIGSNLEFPIKGLKPTIYSVQDELDPETSPWPRKRVTVPRDKFFKTVLASVFGHDYTLNEIVQFEAHVMGAVHAGKPNNEKEEVLRAIEESHLLGGPSPSLRQLRAIGRVVLRALEPLKLAVENSNPN